MCRITRIWLRSLSIKEFVSKSISLYIRQQNEEAIHQRRNLKTRKKARWLQHHVSVLFWWLSSCSASSQLPPVVWSCLYDFSSKAWTLESCGALSDNFLFFFLTARSLKSTTVSINDVQAGKDYQTFVPKEEGVSDAEGFITEDYTPARKKPPIHNWWS